MVTLLTQGGIAGSPELTSAPFTPVAGDTVLVAGKGHENYQLLGPRTIHFDDREVVREIAAELSGQPS